ncbi:hypothetical protein MNBD_ACTINO01-718 [hydrothermal vent metagenome]|uniref:Uncharacterized protein n=1 Tax=hydrothermal vent metagenome TaxID=652676 RepID=A0A3B0SYY9_9ZZZZ
MRPSPRIGHIRNGARFSAVDGLGPGYGNMDVSAYAEAGAELPSGA